MLHAMPSVMYNILAAWLHTISGAITVALSALLQAYGPDKSTTVMALIVPAALTTMVLFWYDSCRSAFSFTFYATATSRYKDTCPAKTHLSGIITARLHLDISYCCRYSGHLARVNNIFALDQPDQMKKQFHLLLKEVLRYYLVEGGTDKDISKHSALIY